MTTSRIYSTTYRLLFNPVVGVLLVRPSRIVLFDATLPSAEDSGQSSSWSNIIGWRRDWNARLEKKISITLAILRIYGLSSLFLHYYYELAVDVLFIFLLPSLPVYSHQITWIPIWIFHGLSSQTGWTSAHIAEWAIGFPVILTWQGCAKAVTILWIQRKPLGGWKIRPPE